MHKKNLNDSIAVFTVVVGKCSPTCSSALSHPLTNDLGAGGKVESLQFGVDHAILLLTHIHEAPHVHKHCNTIRVSDYSHMRLEFPQE